MPSSQVQTVTLVPHPECRRLALHRIGVRVALMPNGALMLAYRLEGDIDRLRVPSPRSSTAADRLWQHTCCEIFIARQNAAAYHEFNLAPSGEWAVYAFERYRERVPAQYGNSDMFDPQIVTRSTPSTFELDAVIPLEQFSLAAPLVVGLSVVVEDDDGSLSYWALKHAPGKPDFHHPDAFALELDEIRN